MTTRGFVCANCGGRLQVERTVTPCTGRVVRYRKCPKCNYRVVTEERVRAIADGRAAAAKTSGG